MLPSRRGAAPKNPAPAGRGAAEHHGCAGLPRRADMPWGTRPELARPRRRTRTHTGGVIDSSRTGGTGGAIRSAVGTEETTQIVMRSNVYPRSSSAGPNPAQEG
ncbi:hypothetical protein GCM10027168_26240 [Streptomyces capparidis]